MRMLLREGLTQREALARLFDGVGDGDLYSDKAEFDRHRFTIGRVSLDVIDTATAFTDISICHPEKRCPFNRNGGIVMGIE